MYEQRDLPPSSIWEIVEDNFWLNLKKTGHTRQAKYEQKKIFPGLPTSQLFQTPKPEKVLKNIIHISTHPGDIVLDFFGGSGTTAAVALKMQRRFILCEQMDYIETITIERLKKVIDGEQGGISQDVGWQGGGSFVYCELMKLNEKYVERIRDAKKDEELINLYDEIKRSCFISYKVSVKDLDASKADFGELSFKDKQRFLMELLDKNMLYVNVCDIDDEDYAVSDIDKAFNASFYRRD